MENLPARVPHTLFPDLVSAFVPPDTPYDSVLELVITLEGENIPAREFAAYLALIDRLYGRLSQEGLRSYAHRDKERLEIAEIHKSDLEIIFRIIYGHMDTASIIVILMFLKCLPNMFKITTEGVKNLADAYKSIEEGRKVRERVDADSSSPFAQISEDERGLLYKEVITRRRDTSEEGRLARENRKHIREIIKQEPALERLDDARKSQLTKLLEALVIAENDNIPAPVRFARRQVKSVLLRIKGRNPPS